jgi:hypothetical protein
VTFFVFFIVLLAVGFGLNAFLGQRSIDRARTDEGGPRSGACCRHATGQAPVDPRRFHQMAEQVLVASSARVIEPRRDGRLAGYTTMSLLTYGSLITIWYAPVPGGTGFTVESRPRQPFLLYDYGRNQRMVDRVSRSLVSAGSSGPVPAQWAPDPYRRHQHRYWDGAAWTEHVGDGGERGVDPPVSTS